MGGLLIKQALINAHNNPKYTPIKDATIGLAFFATPHNGGDWKLVSLGKMASQIAIAAGFQKGDNVLETLTEGSIFSDILQEHWRHQLLKYDIISFWGALDNVSSSGNVLPPVLIRQIGRSNGERATGTTWGSRECGEAERGSQTGVQVWRLSDRSR
jgi:hypothetical protein